MQWRYIRAFSEVVAGIEAILISISLWCMVIVTFALVLLRGLYTKAGIKWADSILATVSWTDELARLMVLWVSLLGASLLSKEGEHIRIDLLSGLSSRRLIRLRGRIVSGASCCLCLVMSYVSYSYIRMLIRYGDTVLFGVPAWVAQIILPLSFAVMTIRYGLSCLNPLDESGQGAT
jgi:TRAP-type C4-dicarboxylate transport system permease small subunit